jgi:hypothetical protein
MYAISECVTCIVMTFAVSAILFGFTILFLALKERLENRRGTSQAFQAAEAPFWHQPVAVPAEHKRSGRWGNNV